MKRQSCISSFVFACQFSFTYILIAITLHFGKVMMLSNEITPFDYLRVVLLTQFGANFISQLIASVSDLSKARMASENILGVIKETAVDMNNLSDEGLRPKISGRLMLKNVEFRYPSRPICPVLRSLTLKVKLLNKFRSFTAPYNQLFYLDSDNEEDFVFCLMNQRQKLLFNINFVVFDYYDITTNSVILGTQYQIQGTTFRYRAPTFQFHTLQVRPGDSIAIVGPSGSGKSSILALFQRMYSTTKGEVVSLIRNLALINPDFIDQDFKLTWTLIDDYNVKQINPAYLRRVVVSVGQEPTLFSFTIRENIGEQHVQILTHSIWVARRRSDRTKNH
ncbi:unnamed protein product [Gongylonema pulchrum]|uniref:ABC transporter domain-containing protein n=1 Tax=Gongylonema pulchrum TaxID=637853 RepID=A0A183EL36_9BILA|nr:unnamed protein product [Gongylonema pulchrum]